MKKRKKKMKLYTTYGKLFYKGKVVGKKYPVRIQATSKVSAIKKAKAYHSSWNREEKKRRSGKGYIGKYAGVKR